jgi:hypothetical protein
MRKPPEPRSPKPAPTDPDRHYSEHSVTEPTKAPPTTPGRGLLTPHPSATPMKASSARSTTDNTRVGAVGVVVVAQAPAGVWRIVRGCRCRGDGRGSAWLAADGAAARQAGGGDRRVEPAEVAAAFGVAWHTAHTALVAAAAWWRIWGGRGLVRWTGVGHGTRRRRRSGRQGAAWRDQGHRLPHAQALKI